MTRPAILLCALGALALSACSKEAEPSAPAATEAAPSVSEAPVTAAPSAMPTEDAAVANEIPEVLQGRWGLVEADCEEGRPDAKGLMVVSADRLKFYEAVARLGKIADRTDSKVRAAFAFTGEGQTWHQDMLLETKGDGILLRRDYGPDALPEPLTYQRCP
ncbi:MAG TPA: hypothetical protein VJM34_00440 [Novosphingobium sp.]|nr:hypothetical protein [Novosphingobium sp.]